MKNAKKAVAVLLSLVLAFGVFTYAVCAEPGEETEYKTGDIIEYGSYPQSEVKDDATLNALNRLITDESWISYGYYASDTGEADDGTMHPTDCMEYADVTYNGERYRAVKINNWRPTITYNKTGTNLNQYYAGYHVSNVYWFIYEPVKWRVLDPSTGFVMSDGILDSQPINNVTYKDGLDGYNCTKIWADTTHTYCANDYNHSDVKAWLNGDFTDTAFSDAEKENINTSVLTTKCYFTLSGRTTSGITDYSLYDLPDSEDKVFLLSWDEVTDSSYGFDPNFEGEAKTRMLLASDYAKCQGVNVYRPEASEYKGYSCWWLRTPTSFCNGSCYVGVNGYSENFSYYPNAGTAEHGICPAMRLSKNIIPRSDEPAEKLYSARFIADGKIVSQEKYREGDPIAVPEAPYVYGSYFYYWTPSVPAAMPAKDMVFTAFYYYKPPVADYELPAFPEVSAPYKTYVTLNINLSGAPQDAVVYINGAPANANGGVYSANIGQVTSGRDITVTVTQDGNTLDSDVIRLNVKTDFVSKLSSVFSNFIFNLFKWKTVNVNI